MNADAQIQTPPMQDGRRHMPVSVMILSTLLFGAFAITAVALAFTYFWPAGLVLAMILGWRGGFVPQAATLPSAEEMSERVRALSPEANQRSSGNASFDAYRADMLQRLEDEQEDFERFLARLRAAEDKSEFDHFLDQRAIAARASRGEQVFDGQPA